MLTVYVFSLILGGGFLALSVLGDVFGGDVGDVELDFDVDADVDLDVDTAPGALRILSLRTVVYALFGFGAVGTLLSLFWQGSNQFLTAVFAALAGAASGLLISTMFRYLKASDTGDRLDEASFVGLSGKVSLPITGSSAGVVTVHRGDRSFKLRALPHSSTGGADPEGWDAVLVVDMEGGIARIVPVDEDSFRLPSGE